MENKRTIPYDIIDWVTLAHEFLFVVDVDMVCDCV